ncbi:DNA gyrase subunit B [Patescibacteria group bacterium]|nr:DNA gyrase subunit B [Patescibacteria group bacterium]
MPKINQNYNEDQIQVLEGLDAVKKRPGMYIGSTDITGLHHLTTEIIDNSVDEALNGFADRIKITIFKDTSIAISDNGRGIPVAVKKEYGVSAMELAATRLHAGGKFGGSGYKVSGGLHGVGLSVVNALSTEMEIWVKKEDGVYYQKYLGGKPEEKVKKLSVFKNEHFFTNSKTGTTVKFTPDKSIFETTNTDIKHILQKCKSFAYLLSSLYFEINDERSNLKTSYYFEGGIKSYIEDLNKNKNSVCKVFYVKGESENIEVELAMQYTDVYTENLISFANNIVTPFHGHHVTGFKIALTKIINDYAKEKGLLKGEKSLSGEDIREGLTALINVKIESDRIQYEGQTKEKLGTPEARSAVENVFREAFKTYLEENPKDAQNIIDKNLLTQRARLASKAARETVIRKGALDSTSLPGKLADCSSKKPEECEIFIVEGDSAAGPAKQARNRHFQAVLPIFGKVLNVEKARLDKILEEKKLQDVIIALGTSIGDSMDIKKLRYSKIIVMSDADVDGAHIQTLYLTFFFRHFKQLLDNGNIYLATPPLYRMQKGKEYKYVFTDLEKDALVLKWGENITINRFKGLGEMNAEQLWETTMNPETRTLKKINVEDAQIADEVFTTLMGVEVAPRKKFIQSHAKKANLDL